MKLNFEIFLFILLFSNSTSRFILVHILSFRYGILALFVILSNVIYYLKVSERNSMLRISGSGEISLTNDSISIDRI